MENPPKDWGKSMRHILCRIIVPQSLIRMLSEGQKSTYLVLAKPWFHHRYHHQQMGWFTNQQISKTRLHNYVFSWIKQPVNMEERASEWIYIYTYIYISNTHIIIYTCFFSCVDTEITSEIHIYTWNHHQWISTNTLWCHETWLAGKSPKWLEVSS